MNTQQISATISSTNCRAVVGVTWKWLVHFARESNVPVWTVGGRRLIPSAPLLQAFERASARAEPDTTAGEVARLKAEILRELHGSS